MTKLYLAFVIIAAFKKPYSADEVSVKCTTEFCEEYVQRFPCPELDPECSNPDVSLVIPSATVCNCCEQCFLFQELGEDCVVGHLGQPLPKVMCRPGTECRQGKCEKMHGPDPDFYPGYECEGGKCHCTVLENEAKRQIFGVFEEKDINGEKQCECAISSYTARTVMNKLLPIPNAFVPTPRCLPNGQFEPLQCFDNVCGCVDKSTGMWDLSVPKVPISALEPGRPKCFDNERHKIGQYYKDCEKERNSLMSDKSQEDSGETSILLSHAVQCTPDGEYEQP